MDAIDLTLLTLLADNARTTFADLATATELSGPSTAERVRKLEERGAILGYSARIAPEALGLGLTALVAVTLAGPEYREKFLSGIAALPGVVECHHVAGDDDYVIKAHVAGTSGLEAFVSGGLKALPGVVRTRTSVVLSTPLERPLSPSIER
jgi:Lrp/AsnC family transcriptional regulator, leucine-responsive regulatory protein